MKLIMDKAMCGWLAQKDFSDFYAARSVAHAVHRGAVPTGAEAACWHETVKACLQDCVHVGASADTVAIFFCGNGDTVKIYVEADGTIRKTVIR